MVVWIIGWIWCLVCCVVFVSIWCLCFDKCLVQCTWVVFELVILVIAGLQLDVCLIFDAHTVWSYFICTWFYWLLYCGYFGLVCFLGCLNAVCLEYVVCFYWLLFCLRGCVWLRFVCWLVCLVDLLNLFT